MTKKRHGMPKRRDPVAKQLREDPQYGQRIVPDYKKYNRSKERNQRIDTYIEDGWGWESIEFDEDELDDIGTGNLYGDE